MINIIIGIIIFGIFSWLLIRGASCCKLPEEEAWEAEVQTEFLQDYRNTHKGGNGK